MKSKILRDVATTATIFTFLIVGISGVCLYFGVRAGAIKNVHQIVGLAMVAASILHIIANFAAFKKYLHGAKAAVIALTVIAALLITIFTPSSGAPAVKQAYFSVVNLPLSDAIAAFKSDEAKFNAWLAEKNIEFKNLTIKEFAANSGLSEEEILKQILPQMKH